jgi:peptidoglycan/LPS O-acetylase OafA/YrhL
LAPRIAAASRTLDQKLGDLTYPLYLSHMAALLIALTVTAASSILAWPVALGMCLLVARLMHQFVEVPLMLVRQRIRGRTASLGTRATAVV